MKYKIAWLLELYPDMATKIQHYKDEGLRVRKDGEWFDGARSYEVWDYINAKNDHEAKALVDKYEFFGLNVDVFSVFKGRKLLFTEEGAI